MTARPLNPPAVELAEMAATLARYEVYCRERMDADTPGSPSFFALALNLHWARLDAERLRDAAKGVCDR